MGFKKQLAVLQMASAMFGADMTGGMKRKNLSAPMTFKYGHYKGAMRNKIARRRRANKIANKSRIVNR